MKPIYHSKLSVKKYGGTVDDYQPIHDFIDHSKSSVADVRHRAMLHSSWGCYLAEQVFGIVIVNSDGKEVCVRDIAEEHIQQDLGFIPTMEHWLKNMRIEPWMGGDRKHNRAKSKHIKFDKD
jgi:hypothetical protein